MKHIILLHGWGLTGSKYKDLLQLLIRNGFDAYGFDLPGFGSETLKNTSNLDDYVEFVRNKIQEKKIVKPIIIGHSFGGRVALKYAWKYPAETAKIILTGVPVIRHISLKGKIGYLVAIIFGKLSPILPEAAKNKIRKVLYFAIGERDYYKAGPLKQVFKNIISEDLTRYVKEVRVPMYLVWGVLDRLTPVSDVEKIKKLNPESKSVIVENYGHKLPYENPQLFFNSIKNFL